MADYLSVFILKYAKKEKVFYCLDRCASFSVGRLACVADGIVCVCEIKVLAAKPCSKKRE